MAESFCLICWLKHSQDPPRFKSGEKLSPHLYGKWPSHPAGEHVKVGDIVGDMFEKCSLSHLLFHTCKFSDFWTIFFHSCVYNNSLIICYGGVCAQLCPTLCDPWIPCPWNFPGENTGVGCHFLLQGSFPT